MKLRGPAFSVVVPAFNAEATVATTVASVLSQTLTDLEVIVVNDGSTDSTAMVVERVADPRVRLVSQRNKGLAAARNAGIAAAQGRHIAFLDSDDLWLPPYLELAEQALARTPRPGFAYTIAHQFDATTGKVRKRPAGSARPLSARSDGHEFLLELLRGNFVWVSTVVPRKVLDEIGGFDAAANPAEDYEMWLRITMRGYDVARVPGRQGLYRMHDRQMSRDELRMRRGELAALTSIRVEDMPTAVHREMLLQRRVKVERELRLLADRTPRAVVAARRLRRAAGRIRRRAGLGERWTKSLPADLAAVFPDLTAV